MKITFKEFTEHFDQKDKKFVLDVSFPIENENVRVYSLEDWADIDSFNEMYGHYEIKDFMIDPIDDYYGNRLIVHFDLMPPS